MKDEPLVSILINNYNYGRFISEAIDSALSQTYPHVEVIVVDDGSTDNSHEIIKNYKDKIIPVLKENGGQASAFNAGFAASKGDIICFLDADDTFVPEKTAKIANVFGERQDTGWCFHSLKVVDINSGTLLKRRKNSGNTYTTLDSQQLPENSSRECDFRSHIKKGKLSFIVPPTSGLCFRRLLLQQILPMPESQGSAGADRYVKYLAIALSKGFLLDEDLTVQKVHGNNAYTAMNGKQQHRANSITRSAVWTRAKFPEFAKFANRSFAKGLSLYWRTGKVEEKSRELVQNYLSATSPMERLEINLRASYYYLKFWDRT